MRITVIGAAGEVGRRIVAEAAARGHRVTAAGRSPAPPGAHPPGVTFRRADAADPAAVALLAVGQDVLVGATRPAAGAEHELAGTTRGLLAGAARAGVRLVLVGGAATLALPGRGGLTLWEDPSFPAGLRPIARACAEQLRACLKEEAADWTYLSPPALLHPGTRTGGYRLGGEELLTGPDGTSAISMEDFAVALLDEVERPRHRRRRFTVAAGDVPAATGARG
ncbi:NAD(P)-dependent oxidoreductase [Streptomyces hoynatensis]|uniref:NAD-dependent epimerase/dehydratase family protein n=1 Tax=Streptomyces hoynatensis TaxID=1141874 RepID=A0A3A9Z6D4_9ACTN|nr:NAD(P)H-binding protein [Streptomyces hoynatensis]RKN43931.1 NAD-dependent epimerase/dehydratase family protein [Streptomyces hoynatensis]